MGINPERREERLSITIAYLSSLMKPGRGPLGSPEKSKAERSSTWRRLPFPAPTMPFIRVASISGGSLPVVVPLDIELCAS